MGRQGAVSYIIIKSIIEMPLIPQIIDHRNVEISLSVFDYNINEPCDNLIALNHLQNQPDLLCLLIRELANGPYGSFSYLFPLPVGFGEGVGFIGLALVLGGAVAQMHGILGIFL